MKTGPCLRPRLPRPIGWTCDHFVSREICGPCECELDRECGSVTRCPDYICEADWTDHNGAPFHKERFWVDENGKELDWAEVLRVLGRDSRTTLVHLR